MVYLQPCERNECIIFGTIPDSGAFLEVDAIPERPEEKSGYYLQLFCNISEKTVWWKHIKIPTEQDEKISALEATNAALQDTVDMLILSSLEV